MKRRALAILAAALLIVGLLPAFPAGAAQGTLDYVKPAATLPQATGFASPGVDGTYGNADDPSSNIVIFKVQDSDKNVTSTLSTKTDNVVNFGSPAKPFELLARANGTDADFTVAQTPIADITGDTAVNFADIDLRVLQTGQAPTVNSVTANTGAITIGAAPTEGAADRFNVAGIAADAGYGATAAQITAPTAPTKFKVIITRTADGDASLTVKIGCLSTDRDGSGNQIKKTLTATFTSGDPDPTTVYVPANQEGGDFCTAFSNTMDATGADSDTGTLAVFLDITDPTAGGDAFTVQIQETNTIAVNYQFAQANDTDTAATSGTTTTYSQTVTVSSTTNTTGIGVTLRESTDPTFPTAAATSSTSGVFRLVVANWATWKADKTAAPDVSQGVALIDADLLTKILQRKVTATTDAWRFTGDSTLAQVAAALNTSDPAVTDDAATTTVDESKVVAGANWVTSTAVTTGLGSGAGSLWKELESITLGVRHGDTITLSYADANGSTATKTITVDLNAPKIDKVNPANNGATNNTNPTLTATVSDVGSGFDTVALGNSIQVFLDPAGAPAEAQINFGATGDATAGFVLTSIPTAALTVEGGHVWRVVAADRVGNRSTSTATFAVDTGAPTITAAATGIGLRLKANTTDTYEEFKSNEWVRVTMSERVDAASVQTSDFDLEGSSPPVEVQVQKKVNDLAGNPVDAGDARKFVYLKASSALSPSAKPKVAIVSGGAVSDIAGNNAPTGTTAGASITPTDSIAPKLTVTLSKTLGKQGEKVQVTVVSDEALQNDAPGTLTIGGTNATINKTATNTWTGELTVAASTAMQVAVAATDVAGNAATTTPTTLGRVEGDVTAPKVRYGLNDVEGATAGTQVETDEVIFVPVTGDDNSRAVANKAACDAIAGGTFIGADPLAAGDCTGVGEYDNDTRKKVTVDSAKLEMLDKLGGTADAAKTKTLTAADFQTSNNQGFVYAASNLAIGAYKLTVTVVDEAGNKSTATAQEFAVVARKPVTINLTPGWSLVSVPGRPAATEIASVFANADTGEALTTVTQVWSYNNETKVWEFARYNATAKAWEGTLTSIVDGRAYFVRSTSFDPIKTLTQPFSPQRTPAEYKLKAGWNGIGYTPSGKETSVPVSSYLSSLGMGAQAKWGALRLWDSATQSYLTARPDGSFTAGFPSEDLNGDGDALDTVGGVKEDLNGNFFNDPIIQVGKGYLIYVTQDATLAP